MTHRGVTIKVEGWGVNTNLCKVRRSSNNELWSDWRGQPTITLVFSITVLDSKGLTRNDKVERQNNVCQKVIRKRQEEVRYNYKIETVKRQNM